MEATPEGRAIAAATRDAAKRKHDEVVKDDSLAPVKKKKQPKASSTHQVAIPDGYNEAQSGLDVAVHGTLQEPVYNGLAAKEYPFELDSFQKTSVACLERRESIMVAAHTSAGKTVVAEYAIAMAFRDKQRVIYTSPLKALSNQKFRELSEEFGDVGLMTGDVSINPNANCIVMTTEILRSMIYRGSELLREVAWVIFDEVHYMQDRERGVVWEETIIFLQDDVKMVFLSATLSNAREFSHWVAHLHKQPCHVVYTDFRPTPLHHYVCPVGGSGMYKILDERGFKEENFKRMRAGWKGLLGQPYASGSNAAVGQRGGRGGRGGRGEGGRGGGRGNPGERKMTNREKAQFMTDHLIRLVKSLQSNKLEPLIVFSFSRRDCEAYSMACANPDMGNLCFADKDEATAIEEVYNNMLTVLSQEDRQLPALQHMLRMLKRGIGVHHSGLLPILKELIEILFQEGLIKVLFTTETFAMGLNMPARTVVFSNLKKYDGQVERYIGSGEYIQMSGRAGRRGKDDNGTVIVCADETLDLETCKGIVQGKPSPLLSSFRLSYYTLLNLMKRVEGGTHDLEYVIANSFQQFQQEQAMPKYKELRGQLAVAEKAIACAIQQPDRALSFLRPGRLIRVKEGQAMFQAERDSERFALFAKKAALDERAEQLRSQLKGTLLASFREESKARMTVLRKLGHISADGTVQLKGRAACEIDTADELLTVDKTNEEVALERKLAEPLKQLQDAASAIAAISKEAGLEIDEDAYLASFRPSLMDVFYHWSLGKSFAEVAGMTDIFEGSIIRVARRLDELMQQLANAAEVVGDETLAQRFRESNETLRRGIMFSASLYL
eukprot:gene7858-8054_t